MKEGLNKKEDKKLLDERFLRQMATELERNSSFGTEKKLLYSKEYMREQSELNVINSRYYELSAIIAMRQGNKEEWFINNYITGKLKEAKQKDESSFGSTEEAYEQAINNLKARAQELWNQFNQEKKSKLKVE